VLAGVTADLPVFWDEVVYSYIGVQQSVWPHNLKANIHERTVLALKTTDIRISNYSGVYVCVCFGISVFVTIPRTYLVLASLLVHRVPRILTL